MVVLLDQIIVVQTTWFLSYLGQNLYSKKKYSLIGYKGKQVRDNIHSSDLVNCFWEVFIKSPKKVKLTILVGEDFQIALYNYEALERLARIAGIQIKKIYLKS